MSLQSNTTLRVLLLAGAASLAFSAAHAQSGSSVGSPSQATPAPSPAGPAAQSASSSAPASSSAVAEVVVTARKRSERIQDVPVAVTAIDAAAITRVGATSITDLNGLAPSVSLQNFAIFPFNLTAVIRGIGTADFEPSSDPAVALFIDGVYQPSSNGAAVGLLDTQSVEVLRGPQGTLFGENATAGAILIQTKRPQNGYHFEAQGTAGDYGQLDGAAAVTGPIVKDVLDGRISISTNNLDGYYHNYDGRTLGRQKTFSVSPSLLYTPNNQLTVYLTGEYSRDDSQTIPGIDGYAPFGGREGARSSDYNTTVNESLKYASLTKAITLNADYKTDLGTFSLISGYRKFNYHGNFDVDGAPITVLAVDRAETHEQHSVEARFTSSLQGPVSFTAGVFYLNDKYDLDYIGRSAALVPGLDPTGPGLPLLVVSNSQSDTDYSGYVLTTYHFNPKLSLDVGFNATQDSKNFDFKQATVFFVPATPATLEKTFTNASPKVGLNYKPTRDLLLYASYTEGFRSGGFSGRAFDPRNLGPYAPENVDAYEAGLKSEFFQHKVIFNLSAYFNDYSNLQRPFPNLVGYNGTAINPLELITFNAASAKISGVEVETTARPLEGLTLSGNFDYLNARYSGFKNPADGTSLDYLKLVYAPHLTGRLAAVYDHDLVRNWYGEVAADYNYSSSLETDTLNATVGHRDSTNIVNASISAGQTVGPLKLTFFVKNLTQDVYVVSAQAGAPFFNIFTVNAPRTYGATLSVKF